MSPQDNHSISYIVLSSWKLKQTQGKTMCWLDIITCSSKLDNLVTVFTSLLHSNDRDYGLNVLSLYHTLIFLVYLTLLRLIKASERFIPELRATIWRRNKATQCVPRSTPVAPIIPFMRQKLMTSENTSNKLQKSSSSILLYSNRLPSRVIIRPQI